MTKIITDPEELHAVNEHTELSDESWALYGEVLSEAIESGSAWESSATAPLLFASRLADLERALGVELRGAAVFAFHADERGTLSHMIEQELAEVEEMTDHYTLRGERLIDNARKLDTLAWDMPMSQRTLDLRSLYETAETAEETDEAYLDWHTSVREDFERHNNAFLVYEMRDEFERRAYDAFWDNR